MKIISCCEMLNIRIGNNNIEDIQRRHLANRITLTITMNVIYVTLYWGGAPRPHPG